MHTGSPAARRSPVRALLIVIACAVLPLAGCGAARHAARTGHDATAPPAGKSSQTILVDGRRRTFRVYRPASLPPAAPLVVMLHGGFGNEDQAERTYGWDAAADRGHFLVAYPGGIGRAWNTGGGCCGRPARTGIDDVAFITRMVTALGRETRLDPARLYATGISNGGMMAYRLACDTRLFAAIGPDSATLLGPCPSPAPVSVIHIHGTADRNIPYGGGRGSGVAHIDGPAVPGVIAAWRKTDGCAAPAVTSHPPVTTTAATCPKGRSVELITIAGAGHQWPGAPSRPVIQRLLHTDPPSTAIDATSTIWRFFAAHPRPAGT